MLTVRLPAQLEEQLEFVSLRTGIPKNTILVNALSQHLKTADLGEIPLVEPIVEHMRRQQAHVERYRSAHEIADWCRRNVIFTKDPKTAGNGELTPGIYGRNVVIGFSEKCDDLEDLFVVSRHIPATPAYGTDSHHLYITRYDDWQKNMMPVERMLG